jgi:hypothetical protein
MHIHVLNPLSRLEVTPLNAVDTESSEKGAARLDQFERLLVRTMSLLWGLARLIIISSDDHARRTRRLPQRLGYDMMVARGDPTFEGSLTFKTISPRPCNHLHDRLIDIYGIQRINPGFLVTVTFKYSLNILHGCSTHSMRNPMRTEERH